MFPRVEAVLNAIVSTHQNKILFNMRATYGYAGKKPRAEHQHLNGTYKSWKEDCSYWCYFSTFQIRHFMGAKKNQHLRQHYRVLVSALL
jgi:hypothetical protein